MINSRNLSEYIRLSLHNFELDIWNSNMKQMQTKQNSAFVIYNSKLASMIFHWNCLKKKEQN